MRHCIFTAQGVITMDKVNRIKEVYPYLRCKPAVEAIAYYKKVFGAEEIFRLNEKSTGRIGHAELKIGNTVLMLSDEYPEYGLVGPLSPGGMGSVLHLHVDNADEYAQRAIDAGGTMVMPPTDQFYGERSCKVRDPFGHVWMLGHEIEKLSYEEMQRRYDAMFE
jgi:uncharacterized glyoxalase superfamily protein PhnB